MSESLGDTLEALQQLQSHIEALARQLGAAAQNGAEVFTGTDPAGAVEVDMSATGVPTAVRLRSDWRARLHADGLGAAVVQASTGAVMARLTAWGTGINEPAGRAGDFEPASAVASGFEPGDPASRQSQLALEDLLALIFEVTDHLSQSAVAESAATVPMQAHNASHTVEVTTVGGALTRVDFDRPWLGSAHHERVAGAVAEALAAAHQANAGPRQQAFAAGSAVTRLRYLTQSPERLLREIGLIR